MKERINQIMQAKSLNASQFAELIRIQRAAMSHIMSGRNNPSLDVVSKILERFPDISPDWLLFGKSQMYRDPAILPASDTQGNLNLFANKAFDSAMSTDLATGLLEDPKTPQEPFCTKNVIEGEKNKVDGTEKVSINAQMIEKENVIQSIKEERKIDKILVFYSDKTYETFERQV